MTAFLISSGSTSPSSSSASGSFRNSSSAVVAFAFDLDTVLEAASSFPFVAFALPFLAGCCFFFGDSTVGASDNEGSESPSSKFAGAMASLMSLSGDGLHASGASTTSGFTSGFVETFAATRFRGVPFVEGSGASAGVSMDVMAECFRFAMVSWNTPEREGQGREDTARANPMCILGLKKRTIIKDYEYEYTDGSPERSITKSRKFTHPI